MNFSEWFKNKFGRYPNDSERDKLLEECYNEGAKSVYMVIAPSSVGSVYENVPFNLLNPRYSD